MGAHCGGQVPTWRVFERDIGNRKKKTRPSIEEEVGMR